MGRRPQYLVPLPQGWAGGGGNSFVLDFPHFFGTFVLNPNHKTTQNLTPTLQADTSGILTNLLRAYFPILNNVVL